jgi:branched-chain amino acid transport system ATP-binding protein
MSEALLEIDDLEVRYGAVPALRGISLTVAEGEIVGLIGPNGAGKSTTLATATGLLRPRRGEIRFAGRSLSRVPTERIARTGISLVPEGRHIFEDLTVDENLRLGLVGRASPAGAEEDLARVQELFPVVREFAKRRAGLLSGGQQQQLAIARALIAKPRLLLLDEPSLGLAPAIVDSVWQTLADIRRQGVTILLVEQRAQLTVGFADRTYVLSNGEIRLELTPEAAADADLLIAAYLGS